MAIIGINNTSGMIGTTVSKYNDPLMLSENSHVAVAGETVDTVNYYNSTTLSAGPIEIALYDISTAGVDGATREFTTDITTGFASNQWVSKAVSWSLVEGVTYALAIAPYNSGDLRIYQGLSGGSNSINDFTPDNLNAMPATWVHTASTKIRAAYAETSVSASGPTFTDPGGQEMKNDATAAIDATAWFSGDTPWGNFTSADLPSGLTIDTAGEITVTGALSAGLTVSTINLVGATGNTDGLVTFDITDYALNFTGITRLEDTGGSPYTGTVSFSAILGTVDSTLSGTVHDFPSETVTAGAVSLTDVTLGPGTWTVFAQDDGDATIVGAYEIVAE